MVRRYSSVWRFFCRGKSAGHLPRTVSVSSPARTRCARCDQLSDGTYRCTDRHGVPHHILRDARLIHHDLQVAEAGSVIDLQKRNAFGVAGGTYPTAYSHGSVRYALGVRKYFPDIGVFHNSTILSPASRLFREICGAPCLSVRAYVPLYHSLTDFVKGAIENSPWQRCFSTALPADLAVPCPDREQRIKKFRAVSEVPEFSVSVPYRFHRSASAHQPLSGRRVSTE